MGCLQLSKPFGVICLFMAILGQAHAEEYGMTPIACSAPPDGHIEVKAGQLFIGESVYIRDGAKEALGDGWFEATYGVEAEGEIQESVVLKVKITPEKIWIRNLTDGDEYSADACAKPAAPPQTVEVRFDADGGACDGNPRFVVEGGFLTVLADLRYFLSFDAPLPVSEVSRDARFPDRILHVKARNEHAGEIDYAVIDGRTVATNLDISKIADPSAYHQEGLIDVLQGLQACR